MKFLPHTSNPLLLHLLYGGGLLKALPRPAVAPRVRRGEPCGTTKKEHALLKGLDKTSNFENKIQQTTWTPPRNRFMRSKVK